MGRDDYDRMFEHDYDGIQEYDNPLPGWWTWLFIVSVVFSVAYVLYYHVGVGSSIQDKYQTEVAAHLEKLLEALGDVQPDTPTIVRFMHNEEWMTAISGVFVGNCAQCHATDGGGNIGPNLTDESCKNVKVPADLYTVIANGIPGTSMPAWSDRFREPQMILLASYVASLRGTTPANPKAAEGSPIDPWPAPVPAADAPRDPAAPDA